MLSSQPDLQSLLDRLFETYHRAEHLSSDPLEFPHRFADPWEQEAVALVSALLAYGNVKQIRRSIEDVLARFGQVDLTPRNFVRGLGENGGLRAGLRLFRGFVHRFNVGSDLVLLFTLLSRSWREYGSLGAHFVRYLDPAAGDTTQALDGLIADWQVWIAEDAELAAIARAHPAYTYLFTSPKDGSCCKRWCMFLRWMGRGSDGLDLGLWTEESELARATFPAGRGLRASQLVIPLDTHTGRISQYLSLTERKSLNWLAALEVTESLRACDAGDPTRYDFALARLGILDVCTLKYREEICAGCDLVSACRFARAGRAKLSRRKKSGR